MPTAAAAARSTGRWSRAIQSFGDAVMAGGIGAGQRARVRGSLGAYAIDVGSAVDERPGRKSPEKIAALFDALRPVSRERMRECA